MTELQKAQQELIALADEVGIQHPDFIALNEKVDQLVLVEQRRRYQDWCEGAKKHDPAGKHEVVFLG